MTSKSKKVKKILFWVIILSIIAIFFLPLISKRREITARHNKVQQQLRAEQEKNKKFLEEKELLENDPFYVEQVARQELGVIREKEVLYKVVNGFPEKEKLEKEEVKQ